MKYKTKTNQNSGFTLIELLAVIAIIGLLSSILLASLQQIKLRAVLTVLGLDYRTIQDQVDIARGTQGQVVTLITGSSCTSCVYGMGHNMSVPSWGDGFLTQSWSSLGFTSLPRDPWGSPFILQEKEEISGPGDCGTRDQVYTAGANRLFESAFFYSTAPAGQIVQGGGDDYIITLTYFHCPNN